MPEREAESYHVSGGKALQSLNPCESSWMMHWKRTSSDAPPSTRVHLNHYSRNMGHHQVKTHHVQSTAEVASDNFGSSNRIGDVDLQMNVRKPSKESFPFFKLGQQGGGSSILKNDGETRGPQVAHKKSTTTLNVEATSSEHHFQPEAVFRIPTEQVKYHMFFGESSYSCSRPSSEKLTGSASHPIMDQGAYKVNRCTNCRQDEFNQQKPVLSKSNLTITEQDYSNFHSRHAALVTEENFTNFPKREKSLMAPYLMQNNAAFLKIGPSTSSNPAPALIEDQLQKMHNGSGMGLFSHHTGPSEIAKSGAVHGVPHFVHDMETMSLCTPLHSTEGLAGGIHRFSTTTRSVFITKHTDVNLYQEGRVFRESRLSTQLEGNTFSEHCVPRHFAHGQGGVRLQLLGSSSESEVKENAEGVKTASAVQKNESSAETVAMDMELFKDKERNHSGVNSSASNKDVMDVSSLPPTPIMLAMGQDRKQKRKVELPDINLELPALPDTSSSMDKAEPCPSRTQSLDMNTVLFNVDQTSNSKSNDCPESYLGPDPGSRWIKRLKSTPSSLALGTKSSNLGEASCHRKLSRFFNKVLEGGNTCRSETAMGKSLSKESEALLDKCQSKESKPVMDKCHGKESTALDQVIAITERGESSSLETRRGCEDITLSHSWIQRWSRNQGRKNPATAVTCEIPSSKLALEELQKKQFPSIAAMALMGKAMTGFHRCEFQKKESFVVWNTKGFE